MIPLSVRMLIGPPRKPRASGDDPWWVMKVRLYCL